MSSELTYTQAPCFIIEDEAASDAFAREALLDRVMGPGRRRKSSEKLRRGKLASPGLSFIARGGEGEVFGSVRLWDVAVAGKSLLLLGPLAVEAATAGQGIGSALMRHAIARAGEMGHGGIILVGDAPYYQRFGFSTEATAGLMMPGPVERNRLLGLELREGYLSGLSGLLVATGRRSLRPADLRQKDTQLSRVA